LYYDDEVTDRSGAMYGITRFITLGKIYDFGLTWKENMIKFCHSFTLSVSQKDQINIYVHTFYLRSLNNSNPNSGLEHYLFPKVGSSYFKYFANSEHSGQYSFSQEFSHLKMPEEKFQETFSKTSGAGPEVLEEKTISVGKDGSFKHLKVMSYNIWHMSSKSTRVGGYTERMTRLKQV
jgi:hypothetical protein